jgi:arylsulfatase A-like enzyme
MDVTLRSDAMMAELLAFLDREVGRDSYLLAVTADHGVCPLVEVSKGRGRPAKRVSMTALRNGLEKHLAATLGTPTGGEAEKKGEKDPDPKDPDKEKEPDEPVVKKSGWVETVQLPWVYINPRAAAAMKKSVPEVARAAAGYLAKHPDVARAVTRAEIAAGFPPEDKTGERIRRSTWAPPAGGAERCGDVYVVLPEYCLPATSANTGTTHGAPYPYDTHVPLMVYGPGIAGGTRAEPTTPQATAAIFAKRLGLRPPNKADFPVPRTLDAKP